MINQFASATGFLIAIFTFFGLLLQKKEIGTILESTIKVIIGYIILQFGASLAIRQLTEVTMLLERVFAVKGIMPNNEMVVGLSQWQYGNTIGLVMAIGMVIHVLIAKFTKWKYIFLTGHHILYMSSLIAGILAGLQMDYILKIFIGSIVLAVTLTVFPMICAPMMKKILPGQNVTIGHFNSFGYVLSSKISGLLFSQHKPQDNADKKNLPLKFFSNPNIIISLFMLIFFITITIIIGPLKFSENIWNQNALVYIVKHTFQFTAAIYIIIVGVRMTLSELLVSFHGFANKVVKNAIPAIDSPLIFHKNPLAVVLGFSFSLAGGLIGMLFLVFFKISLVLPAIITHFISGGTSGVFGYYAGGYRGAIVGSFFHGLTITFLPLILLPVMYQLGYSQTIFSETDFGIVGSLMYFVVEFVKSIISIINLII